MRSLSATRGVAFRYRDCVEIQIYAPLSMFIRVTDVPPFVSRTSAFSFLLLSFVLYLRSKREFLLFLAFKYLHDASSF